MRPHVASKYDALLATVAPFYREPLERMLAERERIDASDFMEVAVLERDLSTLLSADDYVLYELLRESDNERSQLTAFAHSLATTSPLTDQQARALLIAKLRRHNAVEALTLQAFDRDDLSSMELGYTRDVALQGLQHHARAFLDEAREILDEQQWRALEQFERDALDRRHLAQE